MFFTVSQSRTASLSPPPYVVILISCSGLVSFVLLLLTCLCCKRGGVGFNVSLQHVRDSLVSYSPRMFTLENYTNTVDEVIIGSNCLTPSECPMTCTCPGLLLLAHFSLNHLGWVFFNLFLWPNQEFDNADGEDCSGGSSPIQEDSLSSCPSLPEVYTLPVRDRPNCPNLKDGAGTNQTSVEEGSSLWAANMDSFLKQLLMFSRVELWWNLCIGAGGGQTGFCLLVDGGD